jgi:perosamine synthetase
MIPVSQPALGEREAAYVAECMRSGWISSGGRFIDAFEAGWAAYCGRRHGIAVGNGTAALQAAVAALDLEPGDEVILPSFTIISCALAVIRAGATPVLVDSDPITWTMDVAQLAARITGRSRAIMPVHIYGHPVDMDPVLELAERHGLAVIEDAAEAHGAEYLSGGRRDGAGSWRRCGGFGRMSTFSFYANKIVTTGEGGMVLTDDAALAERLRGLRNLCFEPGRRFRHEREGFNFRLTNLQAAVGLAQLERIDEMLAHKRRMADAYGGRLAGISGLTLPAEASWARNVYWMYGVVLDPELDLDAAAFAARLNVAGVDTRPFFVGMHEQPVFRRRGLFEGERYPVAEHLARRGLYLPSGHGLTEAQLAQVCDAVAGILS